MHATTSNSLPDTGDNGFKRKNFAYYFCDEENEDLAGRVVPFLDFCSSETPVGSTFQHGVLVSHGRCGVDAHQPLLDLVQRALIADAARRVKAHEVVLQLTGHSLEFLNTVRAVV